MNNMRETLNKGRTSLPKGDIRLHENNFEYSTTLSVLIDEILQHISFMYTYKAKTLTDNVMLAVIKL